MLSGKVSTVGLPVWLLLLCVPQGGYCADWPAYKADARRSGVSGDALGFPLSASWIYRPAQGPVPMWPEPGRAVNRIDFDYAFQPVAAGGLVYFASSADDSLHVLDARTGTEKWRFTTGAPLRFAPHVAGGRCYLAGDDGFVYCLDAATGAMKWKKRLGDNARMVVGNERMISRWPCRSGVLVYDGVLYATAGMWPSEGVLIYALDPATGRTLWCNDTTPSDYRAWPHRRSLGFGGPSPQGYLLAHPDVLVVTNGKAFPAGFDRRTGKLLYFFDESKHQFAGGAWATVGGDTLFSPIDPIIGDTMPRLSEAEHIPGDQMGAYDIRTGNSEWAAWQAYRAAAPDSRDVSKRWKGAGMRFRVIAHGGMFYAVGNGKVDAFDCKASKMKWTARFASPRVYSIALCQNALIAGGRNVIAAWDAATGKVVWNQKIDGQARGLGIAGGRLLTATENGSIVSFAPGDGPAGRTGPGWAKSRGLADSGPAARIIAKIPEAARFKGYALVVGMPDARLGEALAAGTLLNVTCVLADPAAVAAERERLVGAGVYGTRVVVHHLAGAKRLPYAHYFANVVVVGPRASVPAAELYRVLRPCGGLMVFEGVKHTAKVAEDTGAAQTERIIEDGEVIIRRSRLEGAFDWNSKVDSDRRVKWPLELLWFNGRPGPARMTARHRARFGGTQVTANGRYYAPGYDDLVAVDAYNGRELWARRFDTFYWGRKLRAADDHSVYVRFGDYAVEFDGQTGKINKVYGPGPSTPSYSLGLSELRTFKSPVVEFQDGRYDGKITLRNLPEALELAMVSHSQAPAPGVAPHTLDNWELHFDFRPAAERLYPEGHGAFMAVVRPGNLSWGPGVGPRHNLLKIARRNAGDVVVARLPWKDLREYLGTEVPGDFHLAVRMNLWHVDPKHPGRQMRVTTGPQNAFPLTGGRDLLGNGVARFVVDPGKAQSVEIPTGKLSDLPRYALKPARHPPMSHAIRTQKQGIPLTALPLDKAHRRGLTVRKQPVTGNLSQRLYVRTYGCGGVMSSSTMDFFRSGVFGMYDLIDDSGVRNFAGVRMGCGSTGIPSQGLFLSSDSTSDCNCAYPFYSSFALMPTDRRKNEDWAMFMDKHMNYTTGVRKLALNFAAPGDRRDTRGVLWLHYPRQGLALAYKRTIDPPCKLELYGKYEHYRVNTDRTAIRNADRPWVSGTSLVGLKKITVDLRTPAPAPRKYTVRLHFAELRDDVAAGDRVFDVKLQGKVVLANFDPVKAGGHKAAVSYEYKHVSAAGKLTLELVAKAANPAPGNVPIISGMEIYDEAPEQFRAPAVANRAAVGVGFDSARLNGFLKHDGGKLTSLTLRYGPKDGKWDKTLPLGTRTSGPFHVDIVDLDEDTTYYYTFSAANEVGKALARPSGSFKTVKAVMPKLLVDLTASGLKAGKLEKWENKGRLGGHFHNDGTTPTVQTIKGVTCVTFDGTDRMPATFKAPPSITGRRNFSCEVWVYNPKVDSGEETMVSWAARPRNCIQISYGSSGSYGALGTYSDPATLGWTGGVPKAGRWHHLVVTYQGGPDGYMKAFADGVLNARKRGTLNTGANEEVILGMAREQSATPGWSWPFSGSLAVVRIYDGELSPATVLSKYKEGLPGRRRGAD